MDKSQFPNAVPELAVKGIYLSSDELADFITNMPPLLRNTYPTYLRIMVLIDKQPSEVRNTLAPSLEKIEGILTKHLEEYYHTAIANGKINPSKLNSEPTSIPAPLVSTPLNLKAKAMSMQLQLLEMDGFLGLGYLGKLMVQKFSAVQEIDRKQIDVRPDWFQGRQTAYSQESFDKIVREGFDKSQEPIAVWFDPSSKTYIVISGHSRWHASEELFKRGQKNLKTMPVKIFQGSKEEAQDYAILESNRSGTAEGLLSDLKAYKRAVAKGYSKDQLKDLFKPEAHLRLLQDLSYLKETGKFIENLASDAAKSFPYLQRNAQWVGIIRKIYPNLTNFHEGELFDFFYATNKKSLNLNKEQFFNQIELRLNRLDFDPTKPLNMRNIISHAVVTAPGREYLKELDAELRTAMDERTKLELLIARAKQENATRLIPDFEARLSATNKTVLALVERKDKTERELKALERNTQDDLFSSLIQRSEPTLEEIRIQKFALKSKALKMKLALLEV